MRNYESSFSRDPWVLACASCLGKETGYKGVSGVDGCGRQQKSILDRNPSHMPREEQSPVAKRWGTLDEIRLTN